MALTWARTGGGGATNGLTEEGSGSGWSAADAVSPRSAPRARRQWESAGWRHTSIIADSCTHSVNESAMVVATPTPERSSADAASAPRRRVPVMQDQRVAVGVGEERLE